MGKTTDDLYKFLIKYIHVAIGQGELPIEDRLPIVVGQQRAGELTGAYASIHMTTNNSVGLAAVKEVYDPDIEGGGVNRHMKRSESTLYQMSISVQFYRDGCDDYMMSLMRFPVTERAYWQFSADNIVVRSPANYRSLTQSLYDGWVPRTQIDLTLISSTEYAETVGVIEEVDVTINNETVLEITQ